MWFNIQKVPFSIEDDFGPIIKFISQVAGFGLTSPRVGK